jgi:chaperone BCS1
MNIKNNIVKLCKLGLFSYISREIFNFLISQVTTRVDISNSHDCFNKLMCLFESSLTNKVRSIKFLNGRWGGDYKITKGIGFGTHFIFYKNIPIIIKSLSSRTSQTTENISIEIIKLGRSHKLFDDLLEELRKEEKISPLVTAIYKYNIHNNMWEKTLEFPIRNFDTIFIEQSQKDLLISTIDRFINNEEWYRDRGIPYQLGILLHGEPGTGKTSIIKALASHFQRKICVFPSNAMNKLQESISTLPINCFMVIEDIDSCHFIDNELDNVKKVEFDQKSEALNAVDGLISLNGRILIMTTNYYEKLDKAFIRNGRVDLTLNVSFISVPIFKSFLSVFYNVSMIEIEKLSLKEIKPITIATLQSDFMNGLSIKEIIEKYKIF